MSNSDEHSLLGRVLGNRYVVEHVLGKGAMGTVYCARQVDVGTPVAIKVLHPRLATDTEFVERFEREAFATSRLDHPNALRVLDFGVDGDLYYLVTEYVKADDLLSVMEAEWPLSDERIVSILSQVLAALIAVHEVGIVHRDLKPENILVLTDKNDDGAKIDVVKVCDFGIAKVARPALPRSRSFAPRLTAEGVVVGTPDYMSPEQARGHAVDGRSDLYSVGVVLYHLLSGRTPFEADSAVGIALKHVSEVPVPPSHHRNVHPCLEAVCLRALSKNPDDRFQTANEMRKALRATLKLDSTALALVPGAATSLQIGSNFSTSSPAILSARHPLLRSWPVADNQRRPLVIGYAALVLVVATVSGLAAARRSGAPDSLENVDHVRASTALVSPPSPLGPPTESDTNTETDPMPAIDEAPPMPPATRETPLIGPQRPAARGRQPATKGPGPSSVGPAAPVPPVSPGSTPALLIRHDPWPSATEAPRSQASVAAPPASIELRESAGPAPPPRPLSVPSNSATSRPSLSVSGVTTSAGISGAKVRVSLAHAPLLYCYEQSLRSRPSAAPLDTQLRLDIDLGGRVVSATLSRDGDLPGLRGCIASAARGIVIRDVDTGDGSATVQLRFLPR